MVNWSWQLCVSLKRFPQSPRGVAGVFIYRGRPVPALDLCELTVGRPALEHLSTRIILINHSNAPGEKQLVGLIAERVTETLRREEKEFLDPGVQLASAPFLGPVLMDGVRSITGVDVAVMTTVGVMGWGVTGKAVGTGPTGSNTFLV